MAACRSCGRRGRPQLTRAACATWRATPHRALAASGLVLAAASRRLRWCRRLDDRTRGRRVRRGARGRIDPTARRVSAGAGRTYLLRLEGGGAGRPADGRHRQDQFAVAQRSRCRGRPRHRARSSRRRARADGAWRRGRARQLGAFVLSRCRWSTAASADGPDGATRRPLRRRRRVSFSTIGRFAEPEGFWVGGQRETSVVVPSDDARRRCR